MKSVFAGILCAFLSVPGWAAQTITIKGSDTMVILNQRWAETYMGKNPGVVIQVTGGGSGTGITALINGSTDICAASRPINQKEKSALQQRHNTTGVEISVARDGVAIYLNESNPLKELTLAQVKDIYTGKITNWKDLGGEDARIILYSRENNSGTYVFFKEHVLQNRDFSPLAQSLPGTAAVVNAVARDKRGIGYGGSAYAKGLKFCAVKADAASPAFMPTEESIASGEYPASRDLYFYTRTDPQGETKKFIDWVRGAEGQKIVNKVGYFPIKK
ncbi:MAG: phosphate ABC transporter substrate-binding protein [Elusimicrobia bacterium]|nr:phosphate ABC transporter substrate-binding protein [Elusimicrobiota bacterium]